MGRKITKWDTLIPFLSDYHRHVILADIERELDVPHQTVKKYTTQLVKNAILIEEKKPRNIIYSINRDNRMVLNYISSAEKLVLEQSLVKSRLLKRLYEVLSRDMTSNDILVFGSYAKNYSGADIDLLVVGKEEGIEETVLKFEKTYGKHVHLITIGKFPPDDTIMREILKKHIIFNGFDVFIKNFWEFTWRK